MKVSYFQFTSCVWVAETCKMERTKTHCQRTGMTIWCMLSENRIGKDHVFTPLIWKPKNEQRNLSSTVWQKRKKCRNGIENRMTTELKNRMMIKLKTNSDEIEERCGCSRALWSIRRHKWGMCAVPCTPFDMSNVKLPFLGWQSCILSLKPTNYERNDQNRWNKWTKIDGINGQKTEMLRKTVKIKEMEER